MKLLAQGQDIEVAPEGGFTGFGPLGQPEGTGIDTFSNFISSAIGIMTIIASIWFIFTFFIGAIGIISAGGDKQALESSRKKILTGITGLVVVVAAIFIIRLIGFIIGFDVLDLEKAFEQITQTQQP